jgi:hypothetical protein
MGKELLVFSKAKPATLACPMKSWLAKDLGNLPPCAGEPCTATRAALRRFSTAVA